MCIFNIIIIVIFIVAVAYMDQGPTVQDAVHTAPQKDGFCPRELTTNAEN